MVRIRPRQPATVAGRPLEGEHVPPPEELDELAGAEAFGPRPDVDPDDPFGTEAVAARRRREPGRSPLATPGLVAAVVVLVLGLLAVLFGLADDDDDDVRSDDIATDGTTSTTTESLTTSSTTATSAVASTTTTTTGFGPGTTATTVARPTVTTVRPSTTLTATTLQPNRTMTVTVDVVMADDRSTDIVADEVADITVRLVDPDAVPTGNCLRVVVEGGLDDDVLADNTCNTDCPSGSSATEPTGGTFENGFAYTFPEAGTYRVVVTATSGRPGCGPYADRVADVESSPISVAAAD